MQGTTSLLELFTRRRAPWGSPTGGERRSWGLLFCSASSDACQLLAGRAPGCGKQHFEVLALNVATSLFDPQARSFHSLQSQRSMKTSDDLAEQEEDQDAPRLLFLELHLTRDISSEGAIGPREVVSVTVAPTL